jgi:hypothetical protein
MAKGKQSLAEQAKPEDIIQTNEEVGSIPFFIIDDEYGVSGGYGDYSLVIKKQASRSGKEENGEDPNKVYVYYRWEELKYISTVEGVIETYAEVKERNLNKKLIKSKDLQDLINIRKEIKETIKKALVTQCLDSEINETCHLIDTIQYLKKQVEETKQGLQELNTLKEQSLAAIKEATKIIVDRDKPKKHKVKLETE